MSTWLPLESNPEVMTKYLAKLGVPTSYTMQDVLGLDEELLMMLPGTPLSLLLLFPCSDNYEKHRHQEDEDLKKKGQEISDKIYFTKQVTHNACGTIALLHAISNNRDTIQLQDGWLKDFLKKTESLTPMERAKLLDEDQELSTVHEDLSKEGQSTVPQPNEPVYHHFIAFVEKDGNLYELDGRKSFPINHGASSRETFLTDAAKVCKEFMARDPNNVDFTIVALTDSA